MLYKKKIEWIGIVLQTHIINNRRIKYLDNAHVAFVRTLSNSDRLADQSCVASGARLGVDSLLWRRRLCDRGAAVLARVSGVHGAASTARPAVLGRVRRTRQNSWRHETGRHVAQVGSGRACPVIAGHQYLPVRQRDTIRERNELEISASRKRIGGSVKFHINSFRFISIPIYSN